MKLLGLYVVEKCMHMHKVLLMQWNSHFNWGSQQFQFLELFAGAAHTSKQWCKTQVEELIHACIHSFIYIEEESWLQCGPV